MKILGEELGRSGRWYIVLPPLLMIGFLVGLFCAAATGQWRLTAADLRIHTIEEREQALDQYLALIADAQSEQRGYLLTGEASYLKRYTQASAKIGPVLDRLRLAYAQGREAPAQIAQLRELSRDKVAELDDAVARYKAAGLTPQLTAAQTGGGRLISEAIMANVAVLRQKQIDELAEATARWRADLRLARWITLGGAILNIGLVVLATALVYGDMRRRAQQATDLRHQKRELTRLVDERTRELTALSTHLQGVSELEKSALSRELHDELGGLLVAARMDLSWLQQRLASRDPAIEQRFKRIHESLSAGVDLKRRVVEELRPTLLDNMGLFAALRWQFRESCRRKGLLCSERFPEEEMTFSPDAAIGVFRVAQEALTNILKHAEATAADLCVEIQGDTFVLCVSDNGKGISINGLQAITSHGLASMKHRIVALGGTWDIKAPSTGGTVMTARIPMASMRLYEPAEPVALA
jgi:signal transduction histidine kinase